LNILFYAEGEVGMSGTWSDLSADLRHYIATSFLDPLSLCFFSLTSTSHYAAYFDKESYFGNRPWWDCVMALDAHLTEYCKVELRCKGAFDLQPWKNKVMPLKMLRLAFPDLAKLTDKGDRYHHLLGNLSNETFDEFLPYLAGAIVMNNEFLVHAKIAFLKSGFIRDALVRFPNVIFELTSMDLVSSMGSEDVEAVKYVFTKSLMQRMSPQSDVYLYDWDRILEEKTIFTEAVIKDSALLSHLQLQHVHRSAPALDWIIDMLIHSKRRDLPELMRSVVYDVRLFRNLSEYDNGDLLTHIVNLPFESYNVTNAEVAFLLKNALLRTAYATMESITAPSFARITSRFLLRDTRFIGALSVSQFINDYVVELSSAWEKVTITNSFDAFVVFFDEFKIKEWLLEDPSRFDSILMLQSHEVFEFIYNSHRSLRVLFTSDCADRMFSMGLERARVNIEMWSLLLPDADDQMATVLPSLRFFASKGISKPNAKSLIEKYGTAWMQPTLRNLFEEHNSVKKITGMDRLHTLVDLFTIKGGEETKIVEGEEGGGEGEGEREGVGGHSAARVDILDSLDEKAIKKMVSYFKDETYVARFIKRSDLINVLRYFITNCKSVDVVKMIQELAAELLSEVERSSLFRDLRI